MLPSNIQSFVASMIRATESGDLHWNYNDDDAKASCIHNEVTVQLTYHFNEIKEMGEFFLRLTKQNGKEYFFGADQYDATSYELLKTTYDLAQANDFGTF